MPNLNTVLEEAFEKALQAIKHKDEKRQAILATWIQTWSSYLDHEDSFSPDRLIPYKRGMIIHVNMGFNLGSETGGTRYALVIENNNNPKNNTLVVIPISSMSKGKTEKDLHRSEVFLGNVIPGSSAESYAKVLQIRAISKLRIIKPKRKADGVIRIDANKLTEIDKKIIECFVKKT